MNLFDLSAHEVLFKNAANNGEGLELMLVQDASAQTVYSRSLVNQATTLYIVGNTLYIVESPIDVPDLTITMTITHSGTNQKIIILGTK